ncbi:MAG: FlgO family outer membrane protein [Candidatus Sericytochromatia bacterium]
MNKKTLTALVLISLLSFDISIFLPIQHFNQAKANVLENQKVIAISYFDNTSDIKEFNSLKKGIADMLITDLSKIKSLKIVEREKLENVLREINIGKNPYFDPTTAQKIGQGLHAEYILTGSYILLNDTFRIDARLINVNSGEIVMSEKSEGLKSEFFDIQKDLVENIANSLNIKLKREEKKELREYTTKSFEAIEKYSKGLDAQDSGEQEKASKYFRESLESDPNYKLAKNAMQRLNIIIDKKDTINNNDMRAFLDEININDPDINTKIAMKLSELAQTDGFFTKEGYLKRIKLLNIIIKNKLRPILNMGYLKINWESSTLGLIESNFIRSNPLLVANSLEIYEYLSLKYPNDVFSNNIVKTSYQQIKDRIAEIEKARSYIKEYNDKINNISKIYNNKNKCNSIEELAYKKDDFIEKLVNTTHDKNILEKSIKSFYDNVIMPYTICRPSDTKVFDEYYSNVAFRIAFTGEKDLAEEYIKKVNNENSKKDFDKIFSNQYATGLPIIGKDLQNEIIELISLVKDAKKSL